MRHTTADGSVVTLDGPVDLSQPPTSFAQWVIEGAPRRFGVGAPEFAEIAVRRDIGIQTFDQEYRFQDGQLRLGSVTQEEAVSKEVFTRRAAVWQGPFHSLFAQVTDVSYETLISYLELFSLLDEPEGLKVLPKQPDETPLMKDFQPPFMFKNVLGLGLLEVAEMTLFTRRSLPPWAGLSVRGGELYLLGEVELDQGGTQAVLALAGDSAFATVNAELGRSDAEVIDLISLLSIEWA